MRLFKNMILSFALLGASVVCAQQESEEPSLDGGTIESQFEFLYKKSGNYNAEVWSSFTSLE